MAYDLYITPKPPERTYIGALEYEELYLADHMVREAKLDCDFVERIASNPYKDHHFPLGKIETSKNALLSQFEKPLSPKERALLYKLIVLLDYALYRQCDIYGWAD